MLKKFGIETWLQLAILGCVLALVVVTTLGGSGGSPVVFLIYRTLLLLIIILCVFGCRAADLRISSLALALAGIGLALMLISLLRVQGSRFDGFYLWYKHALFIGAFLALAWYSRYQSASWRGIVLTTVVALSLAWVIPDLVTNRHPFAGFSANNVNYFGTFLLVGLAASLAVGVFGIQFRWRAAAAASAALLFFGITQTSSRGATLAAGMVVALCAFRAGKRIPRRVWILAGVLGLVTVVFMSPYMVRKFLDRGESDPYNYARTDIWRGALHIIAEQPLLGVGFGQYDSVSKHFTLPVEGQVARYLKRAQMAHSEYLQHAAESGIPAAVLLLSLLGYLVYLAWKRAETAAPEYRCFHEAAILTAAGVGTHALVDNCWTIPVTASALVVMSLADLLPLQKKSLPKPASRVSRIWLAAGAVLLAALYLQSILIPAAGLYYNDKGHQAFDKSDYQNAERYHLAAIRAVPNHPLFLDNLGMVYFQQFEDTKQPRMLELGRNYFAQAIASSPQSMTSYIHMEVALFRSLIGNWQHDIPVYRQLIENDQHLLAIDPFIPFIRKNMADAFYALGERDRAFQELEKAIEYEPNYVPGHLELAGWYRALGKTAEGQQQERIAIDIVTKYRNFKPTEPYEGILLARPEAAWHPQPTPNP